MTGAEIALAILRDPLDENDMTEIINAINTKRKAVRAMAKAVAVTTLRVGSIITTSGLTKPRHRPNPNGITAKIISFNSTHSRADLEVIEAKDYRITAGQIMRGFPITTLTAVPSPIQSTQNETDDGVNANALKDFLS